MTEPILIRRREAADDAEWDDLVSRSWNGTFLHSRRFLTYHGDRFEDRSLVIEDARSALLGIFPAALHPDDPSVVVSHPGSTYGGLVHDGKLRGERAVGVIARIAAFFGELGVARIDYKVVPSIYHSVPSNDDSYAMFRLGATRYRCDLSATIDLEHRPKPSSRRRRGRKRAIQAGVAVARGPGYLPRLWPVLEENLKRKHGARPVHTLTEIQLLQDRFPANVEVVVGLQEERVVAGVVLFRWGPVIHAQYIASSETGYDEAALDAVFADCIERSAAAGARYFDFGISTEEGGRRLNEGLDRFKSEFGAGSVAYEFYRLPTQGP